MQLFAFMINSLLLLFLSTFSPPKSPHYTPSFLSLQKIPLVTPMSKLSSRQSLLGFTGPDLIPYRVMCHSKLTFHGRDNHLEFIADEEVSYRAVLQTWRTREPVVVQSGPDPSDAEVVGVLSVSDDRTNYRFEQQNRETFVAHFHRQGTGNAPKQIEFNWTPPDGSRERRFVSQMPVIDRRGKWGLNFQGRSASPNRMNSIFVDSDSGEIGFYIRVIDAGEINCDAIASIPCLLLFVTILCLNICPF
jgi:hypothetical protein